MSDGVQATPIGTDRVRLTGNGRPLQPSLRGPLEKFFGTDLSSVRVHEGPAATAIGAVAFTLGENIYFAPGQFDTRSRAGLELLGHELAHVVQQRQGRVSNPFGDGIAVVQDPRLEAEADEVGRILSETLIPQRGPGMHRGPGGARTTAIQPSMRAPTRARNAAAFPGARRPAGTAPGRPTPDASAGTVQPSRWIPQSNMGRGLLGGTIALGGLGLAWYLSQRGNNGGGGGGGWGALAQLGQNNVPLNLPEVPWTGLFNNPATLLGTGELMVPVRFPPAATNTVAGTTAIPNVHVYTCSPTTRRGLRLRTDLAGHAAQVNNTLSMNSRWGFFLPWGGDQGHKVTLNAYVDVFLTDQLNGCGILIAGNRNSPTVIHANQYLGHDDAPLWRYVYSRQTTHNYLNTQRETAYNALALQQGLNNHYLYSPTVYYAGGNRARVFGLRRHDGWRFYAIDGPTGNKTTHQIWP